MKVKNTKTNIIAAAFLAIIATVVGCTAPTHALESTTTQTININVIDPALSVPNTGAAEYSTATAISSGTISTPAIISITLASIIIFALIIYKTKLSKPNTYKYSKRRIFLPILTLGLCSALALGVLNLTNAITTPGITLSHDTLNYSIAPGESASIDFSATTTTDTHSKSYSLLATSNHNHDHISLHIPINNSSSSQTIPAHGTTEPIVIHSSDRPAPEGDTSNHTLKVELTDEATIGDTYTIVITYTVQTDEGEYFIFTIDTTRGHGIPYTEFVLPTGGYVGGSYSSNSYDWIIDWGDGSPRQIASDATSQSSYGIPHEYASSGEYQITIRPNGNPTDGWMNAFGFIPMDSNVLALKSIDSPLTNLMRTKGATHRFAYMFSMASNLTSIPADLFKNIDTSGDTDLSYMFLQTFSYQFSGTATIPAGLFDSIDTSSATNLEGMFYFTFNGYAGSSTTATIPTGLFNNLNLQNATNISNMFSGTFSSFAHGNSTHYTDINEIWGNANFANKITEDNAASVFHGTFLGMNSLTGNAQTFIDNKLGGINPTDPANTFSETNITDLQSLHENWK